MIIDTLNNASCYENAHPLFKKAFDWLKSSPLASLELGKYEIDGDKIFASVQDATNKPIQNAKLEYHKKYIDIQYVLSGNETMGWAPKCGLGHDTGYDDKKDCGFFTDKPQSFLDVRPGDFAVFFPQDAHAPNLGTGLHRKIVIKVLA